MFVWFWQTRIIINFLNDTTIKYNLLKIGKNQDEAASKESRKIF